MINEFKLSKKILFIRLSSLGDVLLTLPILSKFKEKFPEKEIDFLVNKNFKEAIEFHPYLNKVLEYEKEKHSIIAENLKEENFDFIIDLQNNRRSKQIIAKLNIPYSSYKKPNVKKFLLVNFKINLFEKVTHVVQRYSEAIPGGLHVTPNDFNFYLPEGILTHNPAKRKICFCPGAKHFTKRYPIEYFITLANLLENKGYDVILLGGKDDKKICDEIEKNSNAINKATENNLFETAREMSECSIVVCNDTGLMHLASAIGLPIVAIFGSSVKEFGFVPFSEKTLLLENNSLSCRPCSHIGRAGCPKKHFKCMIELKPEFVFQEILKFTK